MQKYQIHYIVFLTCKEHTAEEEKCRIFSENLNNLRNPGHLNVSLADCLPLAAANVYKRPLRIYSSRIQNAVYDISADLDQVGDGMQDPIRLALFSIPGHEHYDSIEQVSGSSTPFPSKKSHARQATPRQQRKPQHFPTPRKRADYKSPVKKQLFRKKKSQPEKWKRNVRKYKYTHGEAYTGRTGRRFFKTYWNFGSYEKQRNFICHNVEQSETKRCKTKRKTKANAFYLPVEEKKERVCKPFFLGILDIGKKTIDYALKKKKHGAFVGEDFRGKKSSINKTPDLDANYVRQHIESFPTVSSHYTRKDSQRKYLDANLTVRKMYELYKIKCKDSGKRVCSMNVYRYIFCNEYNFSFHKPKKDQCIVCSVYEEKRRQGNVTEKNTELFSDHQDLKEKSRAEKRTDKERAQSDKSFIAATFDLEAVLPTPSCKVGDLYYKLCLSSYNLSFYSLGDKKGTCYIWDETNGGRGSCEVGTCLLLHINSVAEKSPHVNEKTYYSDTCGGQNRNQFVSSAMFYAMHHHDSIEAINHKFFEKGHSEMESDSIHAAVERAKRNTNVYHPSQWDTVVSMARQRNPYIVIPLYHKDFYNLKTLRKSICKNMKTTTDGGRVNWLKVKWIRVAKEAPESMFVNYTFDPENFIEMNVSARGRGRNVNVGNVQLLTLYNEKLPVSQAKKDDLVSMCKSGIIPLAHHAYYEELSTGKGVKGRLPEPDANEEEQDTEED
ncbi:hypothetical protein FSP39_012887 [Pinctada imbricata]|uniref:Uncharacterized protein n=1 Tax=Pinctada imbricata TaxID=66713 RepID=A0AA88XRZ5_PINIB|nr:hypothetical protein FSP39_012887 [Pinctada imbricata]